MPINVPQFSGGRGIPWLTTDVAAEAKMLRARRQAQGLAMLAGGIRHGAMDYMKGGLRGVLDPAYAEEQQKARTEQAELESRLNQQQLKAVDESTPGTEKGQAAAEPVVSPDGDKSWLSELGDVGGGFLKKVYYGPSGAPVDTQRVARMKGQVARAEDVRRDVQAAAGAIKFQRDPAALIRKIATKGYGGLEPGDIEAPDQVPAAIKGTPGYQTALQEAGGDPKKVDMNRVRELNLKYSGETEEQRQTIIEKHRAPTFAEERKQEEDEFIRNLYGPNPTPKQRAKGMLLFMRKGRAAGGTGAAGGKPTATQQRHDRAQAILDAGMPPGVHPTEAQIQIFSTKMDPYDKDTTPPNFDPDQARGAKPPPPAPGGEPEGVPQSHGTAGEEAPQQTKPDQKPRQPDQRMGGAPPKNPAKGRYDRQPPGTPPKDDISIWR